MIHKSIRFRIQFWHSLLLAATTIGLSVSYFFYEKQNRLLNVDNKLLSENAPLVPLTDRYLSDRFPNLLPRPDNALGNGERRPPPHIGGRDSPPPPPRERYPLPIEQRQETINEMAESRNVFIYGWDRERRPIFQSANATIDAPPLPSLEFEPPKNKLLETAELRIRLTQTRTGATIGIAKDIRPLLKEVDLLRNKLIALDFGVIAIGISIGWLLTGRAIKPVHLINKTAKKIADGQRSQRIDVSTTDCELSQLAQVLNETFDKLDHSFDQQVKFTADASHELRTPVAAMLTQIQLALSRDRSVDEYKEHLQACQNQAIHMRNLLNSLLDLARSDSGEIEFRFTSYDLSELIMECYDWLETLAAEKNVQFETKLTPVTADIDGLRIGQVITNVVSNAIRHSPEGGRIDISLTVEDQFAVITVSDHGPGIPDEAIDHIFERFYRASKSRTSSQGSVGLGLAIAKTIVDKHRGAIYAENRSAGATFIIKLPLAKS